MPYAKCAVRGKNGPEAGASQMGQGCRGEPSKVRKSSMTESVPASIMPAVVGERPVRHRKSKNRTGMMVVNDADQILVLVVQRTVCVPKLSISRQR
jgi:hypothetical protein